MRLLANCLVCIALADVLYGQSIKPDSVIDIGSRRELFVDRFLVDSMENAKLKLGRLKKSHV